MGEKVNCIMTYFYRHITSILCIWVQAQNNLILVFDKFQSYDFFTYDVLSIKVTLYKNNTLYINQFDIIFGLKNCEKKYRHDGLSTELFIRHHWFILFHVSLYQPSNRFLRFFILIIDHGILKEKSSSSLKAYLFERICTACWVFYCRRNVHKA